MIDKTKPVMVTGANGYVASWVVKRLLEAGMKVHAAVRDPNKREKYAHLDALAEQSEGSIQYFASDLLKEGSYAEAMEGCELVYHTASPFTLSVKDPQSELIDPALKGTRNVLEQANTTPSVKRVIVTSSCAAIYTDAIDCRLAPNGTLTEDIWNTTASVNYQPYSYSKTVAEKEAWDIANRQDRWSLVTINPCAVFGPALNPKSATSESMNILKQMGDGTLKSGAPKFGIGCVDVREVADAHFKAGFEPKAKGRYILAAHNTNLLEMAQELHDKYGESYPLPKSDPPKWLLMLIGPYVNKVFSRKVIKNNVNIEWKADNSKSIRDLGIQYRPMKETMESSFQMLIDHDLIPKR